VLSCIASHHLGPALVGQDWFDAPDCHTFRRGCLLVLAALNLILGEGAERLLSSDNAVISDIVRSGDTAE